MAGPTSAIRTASTERGGGPGAGNLHLRQRDLRVTGDVTQPTPMTGSLDQKQNQFLYSFARIAISSVIFFFFLLFVLCVWVVCWDVCVPRVPGADVVQEMLDPL